MASFSMIGGPMNRSWKAKSHVTNIIICLGGAILNVWLLMDW